MNLVAVLILSILMIACTTRHIHSDINPVAFKEVRKLQIGRSTEDDVIKIFGQPTTQSKSSSELTFHYGDLKTGSQRLTLNFSPNEKTLVNLFWVPTPNENEFSLSHAKAEFKDSSFKEVRTAVENPHFISLGYTSYIDENSGVTILYNGDNKTVEAIALYCPKERRPANSSDCR